MSTPSKQFMPLINLIYLISIINLLAMSLSSQQKRVSIRCPVQQMSTPSFIQIMIIIRKIVY